VVETAEFVSLPLTTRGRTRASLELTRHGTSTGFARQVTSA